jgi:hypothetical protein
MIKSKEPASRPLPSLLLAFLATLLFCLLAYDRVSFLDDALTSDLLLPASLFWDVAHRAGAWSQFELPRIPSFLPDLAVYGAVQLTTGSWRLAHFAYGLFALSALVLCGGWIAARIARCAVMQGGQAVAALSLGVLAVELLLSGRTEAGVHFWLLLPVSHGGCFILSLATFCVAWSFLTAPSFRLLPLLAGLQFAGILSDKLFLLFFHIPFFLASALMVWRRELTWRRFALTVAVSVLAIIASQAADRLVVREPDLVGAILTWRDTPRHVLNMLKSPFSPLGREAPLALLAGFVLPIGGLLLARPSVFRRAEGAADPAVFWWCVALSSVAATLAANGPIYWHLENYRYMEPVLWWPLLWCAAAVVRLAGPRPAAGLLVLLCGLFAVSELREGVHAPKIFTWRDPVTACLLEEQEKSGLKAGVADYWFARYLAAMSDWRLQIEQVNGTGGFYYWGSDPYWYLHDWHSPDRPPAYDFLVMTPPPDAAALDLIEHTVGSDGREMWLQEARDFGLNRAAVETVYGPPERIVDCPGATGLTRHRGEKTAVWIYPAGLKTDFAHSSYFGARRLWSDNQGFDLSSQEFSGVGADVRRQSVVAKIGADRPGGWASWGPSFTGTDLALPARPLRVTLSYSAPQAGRWQITADAGRRVLFDAELPATGGERGTVEATIAPDRPAYQVDILTLLPSSSQIEVFGARIDPAHGR